MTKRKGIGADSDHLKEYYRVWFDYLKESPGYMQYCDLKATGWKYRYPPTSPWKPEEFKRVQQFMEIYDFMGDPRTVNFEEMWASMKNTLRPVEEAEMEIIDSIDWYLRGLYMLKKEIPTLEAIFAKSPEEDGSEGKRQLLQHFEDSGKNNGTFYIKVFPWGRDLETLKDEFGKLVQKKLDEWKENPPNYPDIPAILLPPRGKSKILPDEWAKYLKAYRLREHDKKSFKEISEILEGDKSSEKKVNAWYQRAKRMIAKVDQGLPLGSIG